MRLYTTTGATQVDDPRYGSYTAGPNGAFEFPNELSGRLHGFHIGGRPSWETDAERETRIAKEELERFRDPATLLAAVREMGANQGALAALLANALGIQPAADAVPAAAQSGGPAAPVEVPLVVPSAGGSVAKGAAASKPGRSRKGDAAPAAG